MTEAELDSRGWSEVHQQERQHRELRERVAGLSESLSELKRVVVRIHRIDVWILIAGVIAALASVILLALAVARGSG